MRPLALLLLLTLSAAAQQPAPTGTVTGHVVCDDTHLPARMASVVLQPVVDLNSSDLKPDSETEPYTVTTVIQTLLDGSFTIQDVKPWQLLRHRRKDRLPLPLARALPAGPQPSNSGHCRPYDHPPHPRLRRS